MAEKIETGLEKLRGALYVLDNNSRRTPAEVLAIVHDIVRDSVAVLQEPDKLKQKIAFVLLAIQQSTDVRQHMRNGKPITRVHVVDQDLYTWAMSEVHAISGGPR